MIVYTIHEPPNPPADRIDRAEKLVFVRDRFSLTAAVLGPVWMLARGLWLVLLGYLAVAAAIVAIVVMGRLNLGWIAVAGGALHLIVGFEAASLRRWSLERRGWRMIGTVAGRTVEDCERRFFQNWLPGEPFLDSDRLAAPAETMAAAAGFLGGGSVVERGSRRGWRMLRWRR